MDFIVKNKESLLERLMTAGGEPVSGQMIADEAGVSRTAVWKWVRELEEDGYTIRSVRKKGYLLEASPDLLAPALIRKHLNDDSFVSDIHHYESVGSTMPIAHRVAQNGAQDGTVIVAEEQTEGRGRLARPWSSAAGKGIWMSVILKPDIPPHQAPQFTLIAAVAICRAIEETSGVEVRIKWPNDLLVDGRKVTGILTELQADPDRVQAIILGIGINVNQKPSDFPEELADIATSIRVEAGQPVDRAALAAAVLKNIGKYSRLYLEKGFAPIKALWEANSDTIGRKVNAVMMRETVTGIATGITEDGILEILTQDGKTRGIYSADIEPAE